MDVEKLKNIRAGVCDTWDFAASLRELVDALIEDAERRVEPTVEKTPGYCPACGDYYHEGKIHQCPKSAPQHGPAVRATGRCVIVRNSVGEVVFAPLIPDDYSAEVWP